ncbi:hypothetical protein PVAND_008339 [Polypedilum vanderplanki]|uniref:Uncharacterized protein n=1 Tax=Polypedilum vanderplanki TaxID=319348 RepID=A0A9J6C9G3_POLVA|nr:hypothetical protein PVAND_008339 [Polypedilum vanderplanki]
MTDIFFSILFFFTIFCFLTYSCTWFGRTMKNYQREMSRHRELEEARRNCRISVYTIEEGTRTQHQTVIDYNYNIHPTSSNYKEEELPPAYSEAIKMSILQPQNATISTKIDIQPRRNSATI